MSASYLDLVLECDSYDDTQFSDIYHLYLPGDSRPHGMMRRYIVEKMPWTDEFLITHSPPRVSLLAEFDGNDQEKSSRTNRAFAAVITKAIEDDSFAILNKRHSEPYRILGAPYFCQLERYSHALFGIVGRGAHLTAYVKSEIGLKIWVPRRSRHLFTYPGMLDSSVAGGVKANDQPFDCIMAEAMEEASLPEHIVHKNVRSVGTITYVTTHSSSKEKGLASPEVLYVYDLELPEDIILAPNDDEVESFTLMGVDQVTKELKKSAFKKNSALVMVDFFIRHGIITPENEPDFIEIVSRLHRHLPIATAPQ
jgi:8-oxo-dGTP pyrophosphatase MutT (NUDIX family)